MITRPIAAITGVGSAAPKRVVTNADLEKTLDTSDAWITERTGIRQRHIAERFETLTSYSLEAAKQALAMAGLTPADLDGIVFATVSPDHRLPSAACDLQAALGIEGCWAVDVVAACPGWVYGLTVAEGLMATGHGDTILIVGAEKLSSIVDPEDRGTAILFGDGAGAGIMQRVHGGDRGILSAYLGADGKLAELLHIPGGGAADPLTEELVRDAVAAHRKEFAALSEAQVTLAVERFFELRTRSLRKKPATAELLAWLIVLAAQNSPQTAANLSERLGGTLDALPELSVLVKDHDDLTQLR